MVNIHRMMDNISTFSHAIALLSFFAREKSACTGEKFEADEKFPGVEIF